MTVGRICPACGEISRGNCGCGRDPGIRNRLVYDDPRWRNYTRPIVIARHNGECADCGGPGNVVDHVVPIETLVALGLDPFDPRECQLLCDVCSGHKDGARAPYPRVV